MNNNKPKPILMLVMSMLFCSTFYAQESLNTTGNTVFGSGGTMAYSVGQIVYNAHSGTGSIAQGVQQAYEISTLGTNGVDLDISLAVFPNPTSNALTLTGSDLQGQHMRFELYDLQGKLLQTGIIDGSSITINMEMYPVENYLLTVNKDNRLIKSFKIIKK